MKVLVTGAAGFIGSNLCEALLARGDTLVAVDNFNDFYDPARKRSNVAGFRDHERCVFAEADITDAGAMAELLRWADERAQLKVRANADNAADATRARAHTGRQILTYFWTVALMVLSV